MRKDHYRDFLNQIKPVIKLNFFARLVGINSGSLSMFMKGPEYDHVISEEKLGEMQQLICEVLREYFA